MLWVEMVEGNQMLEQRSGIHAVSSCFLCFLVRCSTKGQLKPRGSCQASKTTKPDVSLCRFKGGEDSATGLDTCFFIHEIDID
jgi:hypothetical protein